MKAGALFVLAASAAFAQAGSPNVVNARFENPAYSGNLNAQLQSAGPAWFGYAVKSARRNDDGNCCWNDGSRGCWLEDHKRGWPVQTSNRPVQLETSGDMMVLFRVENNAVEKIRVFSMSCPLDAGGLRFVWLNGVPSDASLRYLDGFVNGGSEHLADGAIFAISQHEGAEAVNLLIRAAERNPSPHARSQALFWLAQMAGKRAAETITNAIENDPDTEVKKKAVFALSQLPKDEGVPKLIEVAKAQRNPEVRKQAFFWLGQSNDPRALAFIEQVLTK